MNATGVVYTPGVCRGLTALSHTFRGALYTDQRGYSLCSFTGWAVVSLELRNGQMRVPRFLYAVHKMLEPSDGLGISQTFCSADRCLKTW